MAERKALGAMALTFAALALPATALALTLRTTAHAAPAKRAKLPTSSPSPGVSEIGTLYANARASTHGCTASVVHSRHGDTLVTAAHCVSGSGAGMVFIPGQHGAQAPYGRWTVTSAHLEPNWVTRQDPDDDVAFLTVAPRTINSIRTPVEQVTGAYKLGMTATRGQTVTITGYPAGTANDAITCTTKTYLTREFPTFDCRGYVGGTSGTPWLRVTRHDTELVGVIGGLAQGGCDDYTSYSSPLAGDADDAYQRASRHARADTAPRPGGDGC
jgi:V8-like Glu-specific endopeptidase